MASAAIARNTAARKPGHVFVPHPETGVIAPLPPLSAQPTQEEREHRKAWAKAVAEAADNAPRPLVAIRCSMCSKHVPESSIVAAAFVGLGEELPEVIESDAPADPPTWADLKDRIDNKIQAAAREVAGLPALPEHACKVGESFLMTAEGPKPLGIPAHVLAYLQTDAGLTLVSKIAGN